MKKTNLKVAVIGKDGRTSAIERCLLESPRVTAPVLKFTTWKGNEARAQILENARRQKPDFFIIGPEEPLAQGIVDELQALGVPCIGPTRSLAQLESSKAFTRDLVSRHRIPGNPEYRVFRSMEGVPEYLNAMGEYVVKPDGLTGGKGVKLSQAHLATIEEGVQYCRELLDSHPAVVIEEKLDGEEFSLQSFCDGTHVVDMVVVQDHKRALEGDNGGNTGGMGSYSCENHSLPFLQPADIQAASAINTSVAHALRKETGEKYQGILYGGFMVTRQGIRLLEYNARFGDPETMNVLSLLETDLVDICEGIIQESLNRVPIRFQRKASVCKYVVPLGYPEHPVKDVTIDVPAASNPGLRIFNAAVEECNGQWKMTGSRAVAFVGIGETLAAAEQLAEAGACSVKGPVFHRRDIGTANLIQKRIDHMRQLRSNPSRNAQV